MKVIGIGASAGGIKALSSFLQHLSPHTGAAFVIIQHLSPDFKSVMDDLLKKYTKMPLKVIHKDTFIKANHIYLMPGDKTITYEFGMLKLHQRRNERSLSLPIDEFFHSMGRNLKTDSIGIILSGSGTDGSRGVRTIKEHGGLVLVQSPESAQFDGMPNSVIRLDMADEVRAPEQLAETLGHILKKEESPLQNLEEKVEEKQSFDKILELLRRKVGISYADYKLATLVRRLEKRMLLQKTDTLEDYYQFLLKNETEVAALSRNFLIGVTRFFRDEAVFEYLYNNVIPKIFDQLAPNKPARIWVPACSTGEEAYTIAMLFDQYLTKNKLPHNFKIFASDVNKHAIDFGGNGKYDLNISADVPAEYLGKYFIKSNESYEIRKELKEKIIFAVQNVVKDPPFIRMHLISCRNMLIYIKDEVQSKVLRTFYFALHPHHYMLLGPSESLGDLKSVFERKAKSINIYEKKKVDLTKTSREFAPPAHLWLEEIGTKVAPYQPRLNISKNYAEEVTDPFTDYLMDKHTPTTLFLNNDLDILYTHGQLNDFLKLPRAIYRLNLYKMLDRETIAIFVDGVNKALTSTKAFQYKDIVFVKKDRKTVANIIFQQVDLRGFKESIVTVEIYANNLSPKGIPIAIQEVSAEQLLDDHISTLSKKLAQKEQEAKQLVNELEMTNEELHSSNRELLASNEELQSTNEELQSVNEELYTVNSELQVKSKEVSATYNDLNNLLHSTGIGTIFLDYELKIRKFTPAIRHHFDLEENDISRPITAFAHTLNGVDLAVVCQEVLDTLEIFEKQIKDKSGYNFLLRILPYRTSDNQIKGLVITFIDIEELCATKDENEKVVNRLNSILKNSRSSMFFIEANGKILKMNRAFADFVTSDFTNKNIFTALPKTIAKTIKESVKKAVATKNSIDCKIVLPVKGKKGNYHYLVNSVPIVKQDNLIESVFVIFHDISEQIS